VTDTKLVSEDLRFAKQKAARMQERMGGDLIKERRDLREECFNIPLLLAY
jgi:hypothetical protein